MCVIPRAPASARAQASRSNRSAATQASRSALLRGVRARATTDQPGSASSTSISRLEAAPPAPAMRATFIARPSRAAAGAVKRLEPYRFWFESESGSSFLFEHDLFRKPVPTFRDLARGRALSALRHDLEGRSGARLDLARRRRRELERGRIGPGGSGLRRAEQIALQLAIALLAQERELLVGLDALDRHLEVELAREHEHRAHDGRGAAMVRQLHGEDAVDLQPVEVEPPQVRHRG